MATKPRYLKTPIQLWVADNRKRLGVTPADLASWTGVTEDTARGWESRGAPSQDAIEELTRRFGQKPPTTAGPGERDTFPGLADLAKAIENLAKQIDLDRQERQESRLLFIQRLDRLEDEREIWTRLDQRTAEHAGRIAEMSDTLTRLAAAALAGPRTATRSARTPRRRSAGSGAAGRA